MSQDVAEVEKIGSGGYTRKTTDEELRASQIARGKRNAHNKFHVARGIVSPDCELCSPDSVPSYQTVGEKKALKKEEERKERQRIENIIRKTVQKPLKNQFSTSAEYKLAKDAWWQLGLEEVNAKEILSSPTSAQTARYIARKTLERVEERKKRQGIVIPHVTQSHEAAVSEPEPLTLGDIQKARFLGLALPDGVQGIEPDLPEVESVKPIGVKSISPERYCEKCRVSFDVCHCDDKETCSLCLAPKGRCWVGCPNKK
jgi:hypothetical protein